MAQRYVKSVGAYLPLLKLDRKAAAGAFGWSGLAMPRSGRRSVAGWDEDALTMAVEAGRTALAGHRPDSVVFASTSAPFRERLQANLLSEALGLPRDVSASDTAGSRRCGVSAMRQALLQGSSDALVAAGERRATMPGSAFQLSWGDGAAAALVGDDGCARLLGSASVNVDLVDVYVSDERPLPYASEERFVREEAIALAFVPAIEAVCANAGVSVVDIALAVVHEPVGGVYRGLAAALGLKAPNLCDDIVAAAGDLGAAHALFGLALALERAKPGDRILVAGFGSGCDALVLEMTAPYDGPSSAESSLRDGVALTNITRFLSLTGSLDLDWGPRSELDQKTAASVLARHGRDMHGFIGGRDARGNVQFPKTLIPVSPLADGPEPLADVRLADLEASIVSVTADRLNFTPDPPFHFGLVQFDNGARVSMEFRDIEGATPQVGDRVRMRFRVKSIDRKRGFRTYFWKAAPLERPKLEEG